MRFLVLGAGLQGYAAALDLARTEGVQEVVFADVDEARAESAAARLRALPECRAVVRGERLDVQDEPRLAERLQGYDVVVSAVPYFLNLQLTRAAVEARVSFCDLGGNTDLVREQEGLDAEARAAGVTIVPDCGLAPGMANVLAAAGIARLDEPEAVHIRVGGLPLRPRPPLDYMMVFSMHGLLNEYLGVATVLRNGRRAEVDTLTEVEELEFPAPVGRCEAFVTLGGTSTMPWTYEGTLQTLDYKTVRYPGHAARMALLRDLGLLEKTPVVVEGVSVAPRSVFAAAVEPRLTFPGEPDVVVMRVVVEGKRGGEKRRIRFDMLDRMDTKRGVTAMMRTTAYPTSAAALMIARGEVPFRGVAAMERALPAAAFVRELKRHELKIRETDEPMRPGGAPARKRAPKGSMARRRGSARTKTSSGRKAAARTSTERPRPSSRRGPGKEAAARARGRGGRKRR